MREIIFRGKRLDNGEWVQGDLVRGFTGAAYIVTSFDHILSIIEKYGVDENTICQYTGLRDSKGRMIFEGDIVKGQRVSDEESGVTVTFGVFNVECCGCCYETHQVVGFNLTDGLYDAKLPTFEVIGTIHDGQGSATTHTEAKEAGLSCEK